MLGVIISIKTVIRIGEMIEIFCTVTNNDSAISIQLRRNNRTINSIRNDTQLSVNISVNDSLHGSQFSCEALLVEKKAPALSDSDAIVIEGK